MKTVSDRLHELFTEKLGLDWRRDIPVTMRADDLY